MSEPLLLQATWVMQSASATVVARRRRLSLPPSHGARLVRAYWSTALTTATDASMFAGISTDLSLAESDALTIGSGQDIFLLTSIICHWGARFNFAGAAGGSFPTMPRVWDWGPKGRLVGPELVCIGAIAAGETEEHHRFDLLYEPVPLSPKQLSALAIDATTRRSPR